MAGVGGYQAPANPAGVSGAGSLSQRTDGGIADKKPLELRGNGEYGATAALQAQEAGAPISASEVNPEPTNSRNDLLSSLGIDPQTAQMIQPSNSPYQAVNAGAAVVSQGASISANDQARLKLWLGQVRASIAAGRASDATKAMYYNLKRFVR